MKKYLREKLADDPNYSVIVGCWNCDDVYNINIKKGINCPEYLINSKKPCRRCGCDTLKPHVEFINEKEIMKELVLHHRMQQLEEGKMEEVKTNTNDHKHFG